MQSFVLDCSVAMGWCFEDQADNYTEKVLDHIKKSSAFVPKELWDFELANVLVVAERRKKLNRLKSEQFLELLQGLPIFPMALEKKALQLLNVCRNFQLSAYDGAYLLLAQEKKIPLATRDLALKRACTKAGLSWFS